MSWRDRESVQIHLFARPRPPPFYPNLLLSPREMKSLLKKWIEPIQIPLKRFMNSIPIYSGKQKKDGPPPFILIYSFHQEKSNYCKRFFQWKRSDPEWVSYVEQAHIKKIHEINFHFGNLKKIGLCSALSLAPLNPTPCIPSTHFFNLWGRGGTNLVLVRGTKKHNKKQININFSKELILFFWLIFDTTEI